MFRREGRRLDINIKSNIEKLSDIKEAFETLADPLDMIAYLIDLGKNSHNMNNEEKNDNNIIKGCTSKAWLMVSNVANEEYYIKTDSDSHIVSGLLHLLCLSVNDQSKSFINKVEGVDILCSIGLDDKITSQRTNGFLSAIQTLKERIN